MYAFTNGSVSISFGTQYSSPSILNGERGTTSPRLSPRIGSYVRKYFFLRSRSSRSMSFIFPLSVNILQAIFEQGQQLRVLVYGGEHRLGYLVVGRLHIGYA